MNKQKQAFEQFYRNKHVVITGGAGFIGSHLAEQLVSCNAQVTILDNLRTGKKENIQNISHLITFIEGDIRDTQLCKFLLSTCDVIFHLAAFVSVPESLENPVECHEINTFGTVNLLEALRINLNYHTRIVFSSSCAVYGERTDTLPVHEQTPCNPQSPYAYSKLFGELYCQQYAHCFGLKPVCLRYFNVIGDRQSPHGQYAGVYAKFNHAMQHNKPIIIYGDGTQSRDFIAVQDVVTANMLCGAQPDSFYHGQALNIGTGKPQTILELYKKLKKIHNYTGEPAFAPERPGDIKHSASDCSLYYKLYKTLPKTLLQKSQNMR